MENASFHNLQSDQGNKFSEIFCKSLSSNRVEDFNSNKLLNFAGYTLSEIWSAKLTNYTADANLRDIIKYF